MKSCFTLTAMAAVFGRTPVLASLSMLENQGGQTDVVRDRLDMIRRNVELEARLIDDLLGIALSGYGQEVSSLYVPPPGAFGSVGPMR